MPVTVKVNDAGMKRKMEVLRALSAEVVRIVDNECQMARDRMRSRIDGDITKDATAMGATSAPGMIAKRSGDLQKSIRSVHRKAGKSQHFWVVGVQNTASKLQKIKAHVHEEGVTIRPKKRAMLAFPPMDVGPPIRGARGEQLMTVRDAMQAFDVYFTPTAIKDVHTDEILFVRARSVRIPARPFIAPERERFYERMQQFVLPHIRKLYQRASEIK